MLNSHGHRAEKSGYNETQLTQNNKIGVSPMKFKLFFILLLSVSFNSFADAHRFSIQILASESPDIEALRASGGFDELYTEETGFGLTRVKVGAYSSRGEAERDLSNVKEKGFPDAFITSSSNQKSAQVMTSVPTPLSSNSSPLSHQQSPGWSKLTEEQKRNIVYLDGELHLHEGDEFIPLSRL